MTHTLELCAEDAALERDPTFRREVVETMLDAADSAGIRVNSRCRRLLTQYADGEISYQQLEHEVVRPFFH